MVAPIRDFHQVFPPHHTPAPSGRAVTQKNIRLEHQSKSRDTDLEPAMRMLGLDDLVKGSGKDA